MIIFSCLPAWRTNQLVNTTTIIRVWWEVEQQAWHQAFYSVLMEAEREKEKPQRSGQLWYLPPHVLSLPHIGTNFMCEDERPWKEDLKSYSIFVLNTVSEAQWCKKAEISCPFVSLDKSLNIVFRSFLRSLHSCSYIFFSVLAVWGSAGMLLGSRWKKWEVLSTSMMRCSSVYICGIRCTWPAVSSLTCCSSCPPFQSASVFLPTPLAALTPLPPPFVTLFL